MKHQKMSACYFPTTIAIIEDDSRFLKKISSYLLTKQIANLPFQKPQNFLDFFNHKYQPTDFATRCQSWMDEEEHDDRVIKINIKELHKEMFNPERFNNISVIISDYAMPHINGLEMLQQIQETSIKKILLTGEADEKLAVQAFNQGIIDSFIRKDARNLINTLTAAIYELQIEYFQQATELIIDVLTQETERPSCLNDPAFIQFLTEFTHKHKFTEYYLTDEDGDFIFLDHNAKPIILVVRSETAINNDYEIAANCDEKVSIKILDALKNKTKLLFIQNSEERLGLSPTDWENKLYPIKQFQGREIYYYAVIKDLQHPLPQEMILSYKKYLAQQK